MARRRGPKDPEGRMTLREHVLELRRRVVISALALVVAAIAAAVYYQQVYDFLAAPFDAYKASNPSSLISLNFAGATTAFSIMVSLSLFVGVIVSAPVWLYQAWAFIVPGLTPREKKISLLFIAAVVPLFLAGCAFAYWILPRSLMILYGFTPADASNLQSVSEYFSFVTRFILVFGAAFLFPVFLVAFNIVGVLSAATMRSGWRVALLLVFVFAAVATPTSDPYTMFLLGAPLFVLYLGAMVFATLLDRRRKKARPDWVDTPDDQASTL